LRIAVAGAARTLPSPDGDATHLPQGYPSSPKILGRIEN
jgi:hypothetical protein